MPQITVTFTEDSWAAIMNDAAALVASGAVTSSTSTSTAGSTSGSGGAIAGGTGIAGTTGSTGSTTGTTTTSTTASQAYPFAMPSGITGGAPVTLGTGPDTIQMSVANNPGGVVNQFIVIINQGTTQTAIAGPLTISSDVGEVMTGSQVFTLKGDFTGLTGVEIIGSGNGLNGMWINSFLVNDIPWWSNADAANSRGTGTANYLTSLFNSNGANMTWLPQSAIPAQPIAAPAPTLTSVTGGIIGNTPQSAMTLAALIAATPAAATLQLPAGTIVGTAEIGTACTIAGAGMGKTIIDCTGLQPYSNKGVLVPSVAGVTISNLTIQGASIPSSLGNNAAGVREMAPGIPFTLNAVEITGCQDGLLTFADNVVLTGGYTHNNGAGDGYTHEIYLGGSPTSVVTLNSWVSTCGALSTHALKSRSGTTNVTGGTFTGSADATGKIGGSVIDIPDGGLFNMTGSTIVVSAGAANTLALGFSMESTLNAATGRQVTLTNVVINDQSGSGGQIQSGDPEAVLVLNGVTYSGAKAPQISGFKTVTGTITAAPVA
jgi:hypothetical protein